jgi:hypothetical protein
MKNADCGISEPHPSPCVAVAPSKGKFSVQKPFYYRDLAVQCVLMATNVTGPDHKAALLDMARRWTELADQVEKSQTQVTNDNDAPPN